jgi:sec-independent protein translocase protein TatC
MSSLDDKKPFMEHVDELLRTLRKCFIYLIVGFLLGYLGAERVVKLIEETVRNIPYIPVGTVVPRIITTEPFEKFWVYLRVAMISGVFLVSPLLVFEVSRFVGPGLKQNERSRIFYLGTSIYATFLIGVLIGYRWVLPYVLSAIVRFGSSDIEATWTIRSYVNTSLGILLVTALLVQLPVVMTHLANWGWVKTDTWTKGRRMAIVVNAVVSGILSPPDAVSMVIMMVPVQLLYEIGILLSRMTEWIKNDKANKSS